MSFQKINRHILLAAGLCFAAGCTSNDGRQANREKVGITAAALDAQGVASACKTPVSFTNHGGGPRPGPVTLVPIFWGFQDDPQTDRKGHLNAFYSQLESSNYYKWLQREYGAPALSHAAPSAVIGVPGGSVQQSDLLTRLNTFVRDGAFAPGVPNPIYVVHLAPGMTTSGSNSTLCTQALAYNGVSVSADLLNSGIQWTYYIVAPDVTTCPGYLGWDQLTISLTHEIAENVTNPVHNPVWPATTSGWQDDTQNDSVCGQQIGDLCNREATVINSSIGYSNPSTGATDYTLTVQKLWSNQLGACVTEDTFTAPTVSGMSPTVAIPGVVVTINGTNFEGTPKVTFGSTLATNVSCPSSTTCNVVVPPGQGTVPVTVSLNDFSLSAGQFTYVPAPQCVVSNTSTCSPQYVEGKNGSPGLSTTVETVSVNCASPPTEVEQLVGGVPVPLTAYTSNTSYPPPPNPVVFDVKSAPVGSVQSFVACTIMNGYAACDKTPSSATFVGCGCQPLTCADHCGSTPDGCGNLLSCGTCTGGLVCSNSHCVQCFPRSCAPGYYWNSDDCKCESDCLCGGKYPKCTVCE